ncbi:MAG: hypothetical protein DME57_03070 [Verrucomicrobia bacterium]|nr:MAG: hypothetical protein DME57_03070 [Verrucomicrobiota bacterium]
MKSQVVGTFQKLVRLLHPRLSQWFRATYPNFTHAQLLAVPAILDRESILLTSPTGSGKTLAAFLGIFDLLLRKLDGPGEARTSQHAGPAKVQCIYVSPLRALAYDIGKNVRAPIVGMGLEKKLRIALRTGDTPSSERVKFRERGAHILITTPESLAVMLAQESYAGEQARRGPDTFARTTGAAALPRKSKDVGALPSWTFGDGGAARGAGPFSRR